MLLDQDTCGIDHSPILEIPAYKMIDVSRTSYFSQSLENGSLSKIVECSFNVQYHKSRVQYTLLVGFNSVFDT